MSSTNHAGGQYLPTFGFFCKSTFPESCQRRRLRWHLTGRSCLFETFR